MHITIHVLGGADITMVVDDVVLVRRLECNSFDVPSVPSSYSYHLCCRYHKMDDPISKEEYERIMDILRQVNLESLKEIEDSLKIESVKEAFRGRNQALIGLEVD